MSAGSVMPASPTPSVLSALNASQVTAGGPPCPVCGAARDPLGGEFCEVCGHNFRTGVGGIPTTPGAAVPSVPATPIPGSPGPLPTANGLTAAGTARWELVAAITPGPEAPTGQSDRLFPLDGDEALIGRRSMRRSISPEVSLEGDDGISHRHAKLLRQPDGRFAVLDLGSSNGTRLNGTELAPNVLSAPLADNDRLELGRWTSLTVRVRP